MLEPDPSLETLLESLREPLSEASRQTHLLGAIAWPNEVEKKFLASQGKEMPEVEYQIDKHGATERIETLERVRSSIEGDTPVRVWLRDVVQAFIDGNRMLCAVGTREFYEISREMYGGARTRFGGVALRNIDLAEHLVARATAYAWDAPRDDASTHAVKRCDAKEFVEQLRARLKREYPELRVDVLLDDKCAAKVQAGLSRVRVRPDATFSESDVEALWAHEVETHVLTAQNGAAQSKLPFLRAGGPRATRTQEGLAVFAELYHHQLTIARMRRLAERVRMVHMAEEGADFLDLYRHGLELGATPRDAFLDAQRVCRGGRVEGGAPFTKDAVYVAGLVEVYAFLAAMVRSGHRDEIELLLCGRIALDDMPALVELYQRGLLQLPTYRARWISHWDGLVPFFAFASFFADLDLEHMEARFRRVADLAASQTGPIA